MAIQNVQGVDYTQQGNAYKKSTAGKTVGTVIGAAAGTAAIVAPEVWINGSVKNGVEATIKFGKDFIKNGNNTGSAINTAAAQVGYSKKLPQIVEKALNFAAKTKAGRIATLVGAVALPILTAVGLGRLIGHGVDKAVESNRKSKADTLNTTV